MIEYRRWVRETYIAKYNYDTNDLAATFASMNLASINIAAALAAQQQQQQHLINFCSTKRVSFSIVVLFHVFQVYLLYLRIY